MNDFDQTVNDFFKNYHDRGMKKWAGFFLSDHTLKINRDQKQRSKVWHEKASQTEEEISSLLFRAFSQHYQVLIQLKEIDDNGDFKPDIHGFVEGYVGQQIIVSKQKIMLADINHVELFS